MENKVIIATLIIGAGTYLLRFLPMLWSAIKIKEEKTKSENSWIKTLGPIFIAALLATSIVQEQNSVNLADFSARLLALIICWLTYIQSKNFALAIISSILSYAGVLLLISKLAI